MDISSHSMLLSFKTRLKPNGGQVTLFTKASGIARHAYYCVFATVQEYLDNGETAPSTIDLYGRLVAQVKSKHDWYYEVSKAVP